MDLALVTQRLIDLDRLALDEGAAIPIGVLHQCLLWLEAHEDLAQPRVSLTPSHTVQARWGDDAAFTCVEFLGGDNVCWVGTDEPCTVPPNSRAGLRVEHCHMEDVGLVARLRAYSTDGE